MKSPQTSFTPSLTIVTADHIWPLRLRGLSNLKLMASSSSLKEPHFRAGHGLHQSVSRKRRTWWPWCWIALNDNSCGSRERGIHFLFSVDQRRRFRFESQNICCFIEYRQEIFHWHNIERFLKNLNLHTNLCVLAWFTKQPRLRPFDCCVSLGIRCSLLGIDLASKSKAHLVISRKNNRDCTDQYVLKIYILQRSFLHWFLDIQQNSRNLEQYSHSSFLTELSKSIWSCFPVL